MADQHTTTGTGHEDHPDHDLYGTTAGNPTAAYTDATQGSGSSSTGDATRRDKAERKAQGDRMMKIGIGAIAILAVGGAAYKFAPRFMNKPTVPQEAATKAMTASTPASSTAPSSLSGAVPVDQTAPPLNSQIPASAPVAALPDVGSGLTAASAPVETMAPLGASSSAVAAPSLNAPSDTSLNAPAAAPAGAASNPVVLATPLNAPTAPAVAAPTLGSRAVAPSLGAPVAAPAASAQIDAGSQAGLARALTQLTERLDALGSTIQNATTEQNKKIDDLASRVERLEQGRPPRRHAAIASTTPAPALTTPSTAAAPVETASAPAAAVAETAPAAKPVVRHEAKRHVVRAHRRAQPAEGVETQAKKAPASSEDGVLFDKSAAKAERHDQADGPVATERQFTLQATIPGRLWIKNNDGSSSTFGVGDTLPDGSRVQSIDADHYAVRTSRGVLR